MSFKREPPSKVKASPTLWRNLHAHLQQMKNEEDKENDHDGSTEKKTNDPIGPVSDLHVDGASNARGAGAGVILMNPNREKLRYALRFEFKASNNEVEYKALIVGLELANKLEIRNLRIHCDS